LGLFRVLGKPGGLIDAQLLAADPPRLLYGDRSALHGVSPMEVSVPSEEHGRLDAYGGGKLNCVRRTKGESLSKLGSHFGYAAIYWYHFDVAMLEKGAERGVVFTG
jgi:hypothetical protein